MSTSEPPTPPVSNSPRTSKRWPLIVGAVVLVLGIGIYVAVRPSGPDRDDLLRSARSGKFAEAESGLLTLLKRQPDDVDVLETLSRGYITALKFAEADPHTSRLVELKPRSPEYLRMRIQVHKELSRYDEQYADTLRLLELQPTDLEVMHSARKQAFEIGRFEESENYCRKLLAAAPKDPTLRSFLAEIRRARGDDDGAAVILDELIRENPRNYRAKLARGILYDETGDPAKAVDLLREVYANDPARRRTSAYQLALALGKLGEQAEAGKFEREVRRLQDVEVFRIAIKNQPENLLFHVRIATTMIKDGHAEDGVLILDEILQKDANFTPAHQALADHYEKTGDTGKAAHHRRLAGPRP